MLDPPVLPPRRIVFMGTPAFAVPSLDALLGAVDADGARAYDVVAVFTQPDRPAGRGRTVAAPPVKQRAIEAGVPLILQPSSLRRGPAAADALAALAALAPDLVVVAAYGLLLPPTILDGPPFGALNVHASLLPRWRGAAPIQHAILAGDAETGVTIMRMDAGLDTGPMIATAATAIGVRETAGELTERLAALGAALLVDTLPAWFAGTAIAAPQDDGAATHAPRLTREDGRLDAAEGALRLERRVRAMHPWPGAWLTMPDGAVLKVLAADVVAGSAGPATEVTAPATGAIVPATPSSPPTQRAAVGVVGTLVNLEGWPVLLTPDGALRLRTVQPAGKRPMDGDAFLRGRPEVVTHG